MALTTDDKKYITQALQPLQKDIRGLKQDVSGLKQGQKALQKEDQSLRQSIIHLHKKMENMEDKEEKRDQRYTKIYHKILTGIDKVVKELQGMRDEHRILSNRVYKDHEPRIEKLENPPLYAN